MVAWDGTSELGSTRFRRATTSVLVGALTLAAAWSALGASGSAARLPPTGGNNRDASYGPLAPPWSGPPTPGNWRFLGPAPIAGELCCGSAPSSTYGNASGRITSLVTDPSNPDIVYAGSAGGGVWKSVNGGQTWVPLTDDAPSLAIGSLAIDTTGRILYAGTGEDNHAEDALSGLGILKSTDAGWTWSLIGEGFAGERIGGLAIDRTIAGGRRLFAATSSGLYLSADSGDTWTEIRAGGTTLIIQDPTNPERWWAAQSDFCDEEQGDVITSNDGGLSWSSSLTSPQKASRLGLGVGSGGIAYVAMASCGIGEPPSGNLIYVGRTADYGASWTPIPLSTPGLQNYFRDDNARGQGYYNNVVAVDPTDANRAVFGGVTILATHDALSGKLEFGRRGR